MTSTEASPTLTERRRATLMVLSEHELVAAGYHAYVWTAR
jgi:hypothetical protein